MADARASRLRTDDTAGTHRAGLVAAAVPAAVIAVGALSRAWVADDGLINVRLAENLLSGHGPTFTAGVRAETGTSTLWLALVSLGGALPGVGADVFAVWAGIALTIAGVALGCVAIRRARPGAGVVVPVGLLAYATYGYGWDFASAGLENGAVACWLGAVAVAAGREPTSRRGVVGLGVLLGLGPLLRPDLMLMSAVFVLAAAGVQRRRPWFDVRLVAAAAVVPAVAMVARVAYYASVVPAAGLAKEGTSVRISQGVSYAVTSLAPGGLAAIVVVGAALAASRLRAVDIDRVAPASSGVLAVAGALHLAYVVVVGGDFMLGRMLLPGLFALALAAGGLAIPTVPTLRVAVVAVAATALVLPTMPPMFRNDWVVDERAVYELVSGDTHPTSAADYDGSRWSAAIGAAVAEHPGSLIILATNVDDPMTVLPLSAEAAGRYRAVVVARTLGIMGTTVGDDVAIVDPIGLADPVAAHLRLLERGRPGHEKALAPEWYLARYTDADVEVPAGLDTDDVAAARRAVGCGDLAELIEATTADLTPSRLVENALAAPRLSRFRFHPDPQVAARELCGA